MRLRSLFVAATLLASSFSAHADITYAFTGSDYLKGSSFVVTSTTYLSYSASPIAPVSGELFYGGFDAGAISALLFINNMEIQIDSPQLITAYVVPYNISVDATYSDMFGTLTISGTPRAISITPEPSSFALLGTGLLSVAAVVRRRFA